MNAERTLVWDLPTRLLHWVFTAAFIGAFLIAQFVDDDSGRFAWHMFFGAVIFFSVVLRIVWGFVGSRWARFRTLRIRPADLFSYFQGVLKGGAPREAGHNPASAAVSLLLLALGLVVPALGLGISVVGESVEDLHKLFAWIFAAAALIHILGVVVDAFQHDDSIAMSMIDGRKSVDSSQGIESAHTNVGALFAVLIVLWSWGLVANYDAANHELDIPIVGISIPIGEEEHES